MAPPSAPKATPTVNFPRERQKARGTDPHVPQIITWGLENCGPPSQFADSKFRGCGAKYNGERLLAHLPFLFFMC
ncbi:hypothetical protein NC653_018655 [Populus alba x Populus x berolinensis]|uniref:Uncharacterized protein n=1 Tax=Populus alba x Populus x berolinensis TaxID=444605 RepID=A0AAD6VVY0_9ROSI|nr:hypothetical protein NC653_018655 [Populus alba x Populus x berolinensis]